MNRKSLIAGGVVLGVAALFVFFQLRPDPEIETLGNGDADSTLAWSSLAVSILAFLTAIVSLIKEIVAARAAAKAAASKS